MKLLPLLCLLSLPACVALPEDARQQGQAIDAVYVRDTADRWHDVDPVAARAASFGRVESVRDAFPWPDQLSEALPLQAGLPPASANGGPDLATDLVDTDPLGRRGWR